jgi:predicted transcriptional regulator YheO
MREASKLVSALGETFVPLCEVVLHDLTDPEHAIVQIENNLSGRQVGDSATELGLARMADRKFPDVIANYANTFADGRPAKSTSIGIKDKAGNFIAAICINIDVAYLRSVSVYLNELTRLKPEGAPVNETLSTKRRSELQAKIMAYSAARNREARSLTSDEKRELLQQLAEDGELETRGAAEKIAAIIGVSRSNVYYYLKRAQRDGTNSDEESISQPASGRGHRRPRNASAASAGSSSDPRVKSRQPP